MLQTAITTSSNYDNLSASFLTYVTGMACPSAGSRVF
jgi:hypothetical protein